MHLNIKMFFKPNLLHIFTKGAIVGAGFLVDVDVVSNSSSVEVTPGIWLMILTGQTCSIWSGQPIGW